jgi:hypothetical protein
LARIILIVDLIQRRSNWKRLVIAEPWLTKNIRFLHVPKTAGSTFDECLFLQYLRPYLLRRHFVFSGNFKADKRRIDAMSRAARTDIVICTGHAPLTTGCEEFDAMPTVMLLRDPVERVKSFCQHVSEGKSPQLHDPVAQGAFDLDEFLAVDRLQLSNFQTRLLLGREGYQLPPGGADTLVAHAMESLESKVACFGVTEEFDRSLLLFREVLGWKGWPVYRSRNIGNPQARIQFEARHVARIEELNLIDMILYRLAREAFIRRLEQYGPKIEEQLTLFRTALAKSGSRFAIIDLARALGRTARAVRGA